MDEFHSILSTALFRLGTGQHAEGYENGYSLESREEHDTLTRCNEVMRQVIHGALFFQGRDLQLMAELYVECQANGKKCPIEACHLLRNALLPFATESVLEELVESKYLVVTERYHRQISELVLDGAARRLGRLVRKDPEADYQVSYDKAYDPESEVGFSACDRVLPSIEDEEISDSGPRDGISSPASVVVGDRGIAASAELSFDRESSQRVPASGRHKKSARSKKKLSSKQKRYETSCSLSSSDSKRNEQQLFRPVPSREQRKLANDFPIDGTTDENGIAQPAAASGKTAKAKPTTLTPKGIRDIARSGDTKMMKQHGEVFYTTTVLAYQIKWPYAWTILERNRGRFKVSDDVLNRVLPKWKEIIEAHELLATDTPAPLSRSQSRVSREIFADEEASDKENLYKGPVADFAPLQELGTGDFTTQTITSNLDQLNRSMERLIAITEKSVATNEMVVQALRDFLNAPAVSCSREKASQILELSPVIKEESSPSFGPMSRYIRLGKDGPLTLNSPRLGKFSAPRSCSSITPGPRELERTETESRNEQRGLLLFGYDNGVRPNVRTSQYGSITLQSRAPSFESTSSKNRPTKTTKSSRTWLTDPHDEVSGASSRAASKTPMDFRRYETRSGKLFDKM
ncbi:hypothetical protein NUU61_003341 [Penicillium alfredii]|uniref:Uncharacterized protein n=1 Tax=Penicillium alfredii TaxID=1506179 RepID=A0A9W9FTC9_9EURO|nr:uncharacterized protein NUU61_003341 [Penicillium alfredii]KAJ5105994.1 hypothetical protein NUU61_003341 [Penicillium alfredii]